ncbi:MULTISPECIES: c-type cytochrome [unclassified Luteimonas]
MLAAAVVMATAAGALAQDASAPTASAPAEPVADEPAPEAVAAAVESMPEAVTPHYFDLRRITPISGDPARGQARSELCAACHGPDGISVVPLYPDIAGQRADYMYWQLVKFKDTGFGDSVMAAIVAELGEEDMRDLSIYYAGLPAAGPPAAATEGPEPGPDAEVPDPALLARGERLYLSGDPAAGIPPCQACHGEDARGHPDAYKVDAAGFTPYAAYPSLRGQRNAYLMARIAEYQEGKHTSLTTDFIMSGAAHHLDQDSVQAVAAWLSSLPR